MLPFAYTRIGNPAVGNAFCLPLYLHGLLAFALPPTPATAIATSTTQRSLFRNVTPPQARVLDQVCISAVAGCLQLEQLGVAASECDELVVRPGLGHASVLND